MQVVCINDKFIPEFNMEKAPRPLIGDQDEVIEVMERYGRSYYLLARFQRAAAYLTTHFATIDDPDETELAKRGMEKELAL